MVSKALDEALRLHAPYPVAEAERCRRVVEALRGMGWPASVAADGRGVEVSAEAAAQLVRTMRPGYRLPPAVQGGRREHG